MLTVHNAKNREGENDPRSAYQVHAEYYVGIDRTDKFILRMQQFYLPQKIVGFLSWCILVSGVYNEWISYPLIIPPAVPIRIMQPVGKEIQLRCWNRSKEGISQQDCCKSYDVLWQYKKCGPEYSSTPCQSVDDDEWITICGNGTESCRNTLVLSTLTEGKSGIYRCSVSHRNKTSRNFKVVQTYELEIIDLIGAPPEFLDDHPRNLTIHEGEAAVFQCRVRSKIPVNFFWFRHKKYSSSNSHYITYLDDKYERMNSSGERELSDDVHLSKLILPHTSKLDSGYYLCVAISERGFNKKGANLTVLTKILSDVVVGDKAQSSSFHLLFLIPAGLAVVPIMVWACCPWKQSCKRRPSHVYQAPVNNIDSLHYNNNTLPKHQRCRGRDMGYHKVNASLQCSSSECKRHWHHDENFV